MSPLSGLEDKFTKNWREREDFQDILHLCDLTNRFLFIAPFPGQQPLLLTDDLFRIIDSVNDWLWTYVVIVLLVFCAIYFTFRIRSVRFRLLKDMWRVIVDKPIAGSPGTDDGKARGCILH